MQPNFQIAVTVNIDVAKILFGAAVILSILM